MKTTITETDDFVRAVEISPITAQPGSWHVQFSSQLRSANRPEDWQRNFSLVLQADGLRSLRAALEAAVAAAGPH